MHLMLNLEVIFFNQIVHLYNDILGDLSQCDEKKKKECTVTSRPCGRTSRWRWRWCASQLQLVAAAEVARLTAVARGRGGGRAPHGRELLQLRRRRRASLLSAFVAARDAMVMVVGCVVVKYSRRDCVGDHLGFKH